MVFSNKNEDKSKKDASKKRPTNGQFKRPSTSSTRLSESVSPIASTYSEANALMEETNIDTSVVDAINAITSYVPEPPVELMDISPTPNKSDTIYFTSKLNNMFSNVYNAVPLVLSSISDAPNNNNDILTVNDEVKYYLRNVLKTDKTFRDMININKYDSVRIAFIDQIDELKQYQMSKNNLLTTIHMLHKLYNGYQTVVPELIHLIVNSNYTKGNTDIVELVTNFINNCTGHIVDTMTKYMIPGRTTSSIPPLNIIDGRITKYQYDLTSLYNLTFFKAKGRTYYKYTPNNASIVSKPHSTAPGYTLYPEKFNVEYVVCELNL